MPIYREARVVILRQLERISRGEGVSIVAVGILTSVQFGALNAGRAAMGLPALGSPELVYLGRHHFAGRIADGYAIADLVDQIESALDATSIIRVSHRMTTLERTSPRHDRFGFSVHDRAVLELTARKPRAEILSVIPKGDRGGPRARR